jgi:hypothetical protein
MDPGSHTSHTTRKELSCLGAELGEHFGVLVADLLRRNVHATTWHATIVTAKGDEAFFSLGLAHNDVVEVPRLADLTMESALLHEVIKLHFFETARGIGALLVTAGDVT